MQLNGLSQNIPNLFYFTLSNARILCLSTRNESTRDNILGFITSVDAMNYVGLQLKWLKLDKLKFFFVPILQHTVNNKYRMTIDKKLLSIISFSALSFESHGSGCTSPILIYL